MGSVGARRRQAFEEEEWQDVPWCSVERDASHEKNYKGSGNVTKTREKYEWRLGEPPPFIDPHSEVKHEIVTGYLSRYIEVLLGNPNIENLVLSVVDGFAGGGEYRTVNGRDYRSGSPLLAIQTVIDTEARLNVGRRKPRGVLAEYFFVEKSKSNFEYLEAILSARYGRDRLENDIQIQRAPFQSIADPIISRIQARRGGERALFLLDQYAYDQVPMPLLRKIFQSLRGAEVLLTFNVDALITFLSNHEQCQNKLEEIGLARYIDWTSLPRLKDEGPLWKTHIQRQLAHGIIAESGARFATIFYITPAASSWSYWLVHLSNTYRARDVMMELHWAHGNHFSHFLEPDLYVLGHQAGVGSRLRDQNDMHFGVAFEFDAVAKKQCCDGLALKLVSRIFDTDGMRFGELLRLVGNQTPATANMIRESLDPAIRARDLEVISERGVRRAQGSSLRESDVIRPRQSSMVFLPTDPRRP